MIIIYLDNVIADVFAAMEQGIDFKKLIEKLKHFRTFKRSKRE